MRILLFTHKPPYPDLDGGTRAMRSMLEGLLKQGHTVWVITFSTSKHPYQPVAWPVELIDHSVITPLPVDTTITSWGAFVNLFSTTSYVLSRFYDRALETVIADVIHEFKPEVIQMEGLQPLLYARVIRKETGAPILYRAHNVEHTIWQKMAENTRGLRKWYLKLQAKRLAGEEQKLVGQVSAVIAIADADANTLEKWGDKKPVITLPYGLDQDWYEGPTPTLSQGQFFHIGAMDWPPNQEAVQWLTEEIWPEFLRQHPAADLHLAGRELPAEIKGDHIVNHGTVAEVRPFMQKHGVLLVPLKSGSGLRIKILEAMALGIPVITTTTGLEGIPAKDGQTILIADSPTDWQRQMNWCLEHPEELATLGQRAQAWLRENYSQYAVMQRWEDFIKREVLS